MYSFFFDETRLPVTPASLTLKIGNKNETLDLINGGEVSVLKKPGLTAISFEMLLPYHEFSATHYPDGFKPPNYYLDILSTYKTQKQPFQFIVVRPDTFHTNITVALEEYQINEDADNGSDITVDITLKQFRESGTQVATIEESSDTTSDTTGEVTIKEPEPTREEAKSPEPKVQAKQREVVWGDCLWNIAIEFYGDGTKWEKIRDANPDVIPANSTMIHPGDVLVIPPLN